jgi:hypothetical protein
LVVVEREEERCGGPRKAVVGPRLVAGPVFDVARKMKEPADSRRPRLSQSDRSGFPNL